MKKISANFQITTPMFLGGADIFEKAELKTTSVKGALRFWFRAVSYGNYLDYREVKRAEDELFGSTTSQSRFFLKLNPNNIRSETNQSKIESIFSHGISYLGYGLDYSKWTEGRRKKYYRPFLIPGQTFKMELLLNSNYSNEKNIEDLIKAIKALGLFGGLGSRNRRGFGSLTLDCIYIDGQEYWAAPASREDLVKAIEDFYSSLNLTSRIPEYTAFCKENRTIVLGQFNSYKKALEEVGEAMMTFRRGYGRDTSIISNYIRRGSVEEHPQRIAFGLPHNYFIRNLGTVMIDSTIRRERTRRSSPLFVKIISIKENEDVKYIPVLTLFPAKFLPEDYRLSFTGKRGREGLPSKTIEPKISFDIIHSFMDVFSDKLEVIPNG